MTLSSYLYALYAICHFSLAIWGWQLSRRDVTNSTLLLALIGTAVAYDNLILGLGTLLGPGPLLLALSWPRFALHQFLLPWIMLAAFDQLRAVGIPWTQAPRARRAVVAFSLLIMMAGIATRLVGIQLEPETLDGVVRYMIANVSGPPIVSIVSIAFVGVMGIFWWRQRQWPWLLWITVLVFVGEAIPNLALRRVLGNVLELALIAQLLWLAKRFIIPLRWQNDATGALDSSRHFR